MAHNLCAMCDYFNARVFCFVFFARAPLPLSAKPKAAATTLDWLQLSTAKSDPLLSGHFDVIIAADVIYGKMRAFFDSKLETYINSV